MSAVQSVERAFAILEAVAVNPNGLGVTEIARQVGLPKSTVSRLLSTLAQLKAVERIPDKEGFRIGAGIIALASNVPYSRHLITVARPYLLELAQLTGETVNLCLPQGDQSLYIDQVDSQYHLQIQNWTGYRFPLHVVSGGKLFLAYGPEEHLDQYLSRPLQRHTPKTITEPGLLRHELVKIRDQGYAWGDGESEEEIVGLATPIRDETGQVVAAVCVAGPAFRFPPKDKTDEVVRLAVDIADRISARIRGDF